MASYAFVGVAGDSSLTIINVSNPAVPTFEGHIAGAGNFLNMAWAVTIVGNIAFVSSGVQGLTIIDVTNPAAPTVKGNLLPAPGINSGWEPCTVSGNLCYMTSHYGGGPPYYCGLYIINVSNLSAPVLVGQITGIGAPNYLAGSNAIIKEGSYAYIYAAVEPALTIIDVSVPATPTFKGYISGAGAPNYLSGLSGMPGSIIKDGNLVYVAAFGDNSLTIIDVTNPAAPTFKGNIFGSGAPNYLGGICGLAKSGNLIYCACGNDNSLTIIDVTNPAAPTFKGNIFGSGAPNYLGGAMGVFKYGANCFVVSNSDSSLTIINVSNPAVPTFVSHIAGGGAPNYLGTPIGGTSVEVKSFESDSLLIDFKGILDCIGWKWR